MDRSLVQVSAYIQGVTKQSHSVPWDHSRILMLPCYLQTQFFLMKLLNKISFYFKRRSYNTTNHSNIREMSSIYDNIYAYVNLTYKYFILKRKLLLSFKHKSITEKVNLLLKKKKIVEVLNAML